MKRLPLFDAVPASLTLVRHGESLGNVAAARAQADHRDDIEVDVRDADVDLSDNGLQQADALGKWFRTLAADERPTLVLSSPYRRAFRTAERTIGDTGIDIVVDERLRERDLGLFDGLTSQGVRERFAEEAERRDRLGKFYYRPPQGEGWAEVVLRVRSLLGDLRSGYGDARIWVFSHQAVIMSFRYVLEGISEQRLLELEKEQTIANASVTTFERTDDWLELTGFADDSVVQESLADATREPSVTDQDRDEAAG